MHLPPGVIFNFTLDFVRSSMLVAQMKGLNELIKRSSGEKNVRLIVWPPGDSISFNPGTLATSGGKTDDQIILIQLEIYSGNQYLRFEPLTRGIRYNFNFCPAWGCCSNLTLG